MLVVEDCIAAQMRVMVMKYPEGNQMGGHRENSDKQTGDSEALQVAPAPNMRAAGAGCLPAQTDRLGEFAEQQALMSFKSTRELDFPKATSK